MEHLSTFHVSPIRVSSGDSGLIQLSIYSMGIFPSLAVLFIWSVRSWITQILITQKYGVLCGVYHLFFEKEKKNIACGTFVCLEKYAHVSSVYPWANSRHWIDQLQSEHALYVIYVEYRQRFSGRSTSHATCHVLKVISLDVDIKVKNKSTVA